MNDRELRQQLEALQAERLRLTAEFQDGESRHLRIARATEHEVHEGLISERRALELELQSLRTRDLEREWACFELARPWERDPTILAIVGGVVIIGALPCQLLTLFFDQRSVVPLVTVSCSLALGLLTGSRLVLRWKDWRFDRESLRASLSRTFGGLLGFGSMLIALLLLIGGPALWIISLILPNELHELLIRAVVGLLGGAFLVSRGYLRRNERTEDWSSLTMVLSLMGVALGVLRLPELVRAWLHLEHAAEATALFSLYIPLTGLFWTRRSTHPRSRELSFASAILASAWTAGGVVLHANDSLGFSAVACAVLGFVLASAVEDGDDRHEAQLFNAVALVGGLAVLAA